ncbi:PaaI family thioesterase [Odoribacter sp. OttesenSCG-928-G04]|nr:PaaI family thioesterase [Odoribacter sp. OttesenSCG-928-G04]MDL2331179.1 PaaI family thioesterase [Odoribacter sp. OttesenSCG-928-A06]
MKREMYNAYAEQEGYNCFGCSPHNPYGLKCQFVDEGEYVTCRWSPSENYQGFLNVLHGGIQATLIDEIACWAIFAHSKTAGVTTDMQIKYRKAVYVDQGDIYLRAKVIKANRRLVTAQVELFNADNELAAEAEVVYMVYPEELARKKMNWPGIESFYK